MLVLQKSEILSGEVSTKLCLLMAYYVRYSNSIGSVAIATCTVARLTLDFGYDLR